MYIMSRIELMNGCTSNDEPNVETEKYACDF
jgi:hypothetical protein